MRYLVSLPFVLLVASGFTQPTPPAQEIIFWHHYADAERAQFWQDIADEFNASHTDDVWVTVQYFPSYNHQHVAILSGLLNGTLPDVALVRNYDAALYQMGNHLLDLSELAQDLEPSAFYEVIWAQDVYNGQRLGIPLTRAAEAMYVNLDALYELGYAAPPTTHQALREAACAFRDHGGWSEISTVNPLGFEIRMDASFFLALSQPNAIYDGAAFDFSTPAMTETLDFLRLLLARRCIALNPGQIADAQNRFASGQSLFYFDSSGARRFVEAAIGEYFAEPFALAVVPVPAQSAPTANFYGVSLSIFRSRPEREVAAWTWVRWLAQPAQIARWAAVNDALPARRDVEAGIMQPFLAADSFIEPNLAGYDLVRDELVFTVRAILAGSTDEASALDKLTETANRVRAAFVLE